MFTDLRHRRPRRAGARRRMSAVAGAAVAALAALTLVWCTAAPGAAAGSPGQKIADALRHSPVYVDPSLDSAVGAAERQRLAERIRGTRLPIRVVLVPLVEGDSWGGDPAQLAEVVHDRLGGEPSIIITLGDFPEDIAAREWPARLHQAQQAAAAVFHQSDMEGAGTARRVERAIDIIAAGDGEKEYEKATADLNGPAPSASSSGPGASGAAGAPASSGSPVVRMLTLVAGPLLVLGAVGLLWRRRARVRDLATPFALPRSVFAAARRADEAELRERAAREVVRLGEEARAAQGDPQAVGRALDAYSAAGSVLDRARGVPDLAGVFALIAEGRAALGSEDAPLPLCFFHPLHGPAARVLPWRPLGRREELRVAACESCVRAIRARRAPEVLTDREGDRPVPYFEVDTARSLWAATGYGSLLSGEPDDSLAVRVQRGDFTRTLEAS
ncbi:hypothetical protein ACGH2B_09635 [Streptomyces sp. BBFR2]|uniref:hypothetical protein n=1 Tax=Streptomyces sp. BBFR2 TaxID=3372854 RepID=UPI0037D9DEC3